MKAVILAAGRGKRMRHLTEDIPKPLLKVQGKTFLDGIFDALPEEVNQAIVIIGYQGDKIKAHLGDHYKGKKVQYVLQQDITGTGNAILLTKDYFGPGERFLIFYGDEVISREEVARCLAEDLSWLCWEVANPKASGIVTLSDDGFINAIEEKPEHPKSKMGATGLMVVNADLFKYTPDQHGTGEYYLTSIMNKFVKDHRVKAVIGANRKSYSAPEDLE